MKVGIEESGREGSIQYKADKTDGVVRFSVNFPDAKVIEKVSKFLITPRVFKIPQSQQIDDYAEMKAKPIDNTTFFKLGLCVLHTNTGVWVRW